MKRILFILSFLCLCITACGQDYTTAGFLLSRGPQGGQVSISFSWPRSGIGLFGYIESAGYIINKRDGEEDVDFAPIIKITSDALYTINTKSGDTVFLHDEDRYHEIPVPFDYSGFNEIYERSVRPFSLDDDGNVYVETKRNDRGMYYRKIDFRNKSMNCVLKIKIYASDRGSVDELTDLFLGSVKIEDWPY